MLAVGQTTGAAERQLDTLETAALSYLCAPLWVFLIGWLRWPAAFGGLLILAWVVCVRQRQRVALPALGLHTWLMLAALALGWVGLSGLHGPFHLNTDWEVRMAVLRDLAVGGWPLSYGERDGAALILRMPMAYYMVPALAGQLAGGSVEVARWALWLWTALGTGLMLALVLRACPPLRPWQRLAAMAVVVVFSGMDVLGGLITGDGLPAWAEHIEWWARQYQFSSMTTQLFWVPNHALPAWLCALVVWRHRQQGLAHVPAALLMLACMLWAPLVALGLAPMLLGATLRGQPSAAAWARACVQPAVLATLPLMGFIISFSTLNIPSAVAPTMSAAQLPLASAFSTWFTFSALEWALVAGIAWALGQRSWLIALAAVELMVLPLGHFGPGNDLVMRGSIPALTVVMMALLNALFDHRSAEAAVTNTATESPTRRWHWLASRPMLVVLVAVGAVTPLMELERAFEPGPRYREDDKSLAEVHGKPWHYVAPLRHAWLPQVLKEPVLLVQRYQPKPDKPLP